MRWFDVLSKRIASARTRHAHHDDRGLILVFHEVHSDDDEYKREFNSGCTAAFLDGIVAGLLRYGWDIVSLDDAISSLAGQDSARPFAVLTFDDGYRNTFTQALPILERNAVPFTVFVPTGAITRQLPAWWLGMRALFRGNDTVTIAPMAKKFECHDAAAKSAAYTEVKNWVHQDYRRSPAIAKIVEAHGISLSELNQTYFIDDAELMKFSRHPLVNIGAHSESHPALALLSDAEAQREIQNNRQYLETLLGKPVRHFAYPYGGPTAVSDRDIRLTEELGFRAAVTTLSGWVRATHREALCRLPRMELTGRAAQLESRLRFVQEMRGSGQAPE